MDIKTVDENYSNPSHMEILKNLALKCTQNIENNSKDKSELYYEPGVSKPMVANSKSHIITTDTFVRTENNQAECESKSQDDIKLLKDTSFYKVHKNLLSKPVISKNLLEQFNSLPIFGRPKHKSDLPQFFYNKIREFVGYDLDDNEFDKLAQYCSPDHLRTGDEVHMFTNIPTFGPFPSVDKLNEKRIIDEAAECSQDIKLTLYKKFQLRVESDKLNYYAKRLKYRGIRLMPLSSLEEDNNPTVTIGQPLEPGKDLLYRVRIYRPYSQNYRQERCRLRMTVFNCDAVLLGRHRLSVLRDRFVCTNDVGMRTDVADCPEQSTEANAKSVFPSGFLFINNVFYVDGRAGCHDISAGLRQWARQRRLGDFPSRRMEDVRLQDLPLRLGHPEVYVHQGNCEHVFTFSEVRLLGPRDALRPSSYPAHTAAGNSQSIYCTTCAEFGAKWLVVDCPRVPFNPAFFCDTCFRLYLYKDGTKIGEFKAYHYRGNELNMLKPQG